MKQEEIVNEIRQMCGQTILMPSLGWHFKYNGQVYFYVVGKDESMIRFCIPFVAGLSLYDKELLKEAVNETNRNVKFIKMMLRCPWITTTKLQIWNPPRTSYRTSSRLWPLRLNTWKKE